MMEKRIEELERKVAGLEKQLAELQGAVDCYLTASQKTVDIECNNILVTATD
ncbi:hypothetical protein ACR71G_22865 [Xenorhabdus bovienii]|uniref:hypothetical protein n=1 Tax=Xenorhabdus bovienii TaxID=40576 RepID=UPI003DA62219